MEALEVLCIQSGNSTLFKKSKKAAEDKSEGKISRKRRIKGLECDGNKMYTKCSTLVLCLVEVHFYRKDFLHRLGSLDFSQKTFSYI
jgi:hypothetical protein